MLGPAAGQLQDDVDLPGGGRVRGPSRCRTARRLRRGFSGAPAITLDGELLGVDTSTGWETIFTRGAAGMARVRPARGLRELMEPTGAGR
jgi:hypothetical protein